MRERQHDPSELVVHVGAGFAAKERPLVRKDLSSLRPHLGRWDIDEVSVQVSLQDRGRREQRVTLRTVVPELPPLIAVSTDANLAYAIAQAKHDVIRQLKEQKVAREPLQHRRHRARTVRLPSGPEYLGGRVH
ncbi:hypothetical protein [Mycolicibacterium chubuense]|uniref:hypothetical protein n=1 Tax=Mycolicibacterium chubuense TaxID=1800 RepID=UPI00069D7D36|nr:hypothetical protein [Mycolicibacterium chubuense]SPX99796.1 Sigma 54 modulation protein / S30EA ribosomal protein [Mycolicibacterium chubuense]